MWNLNRIQKKSHIIWLYGCVLRFLCALYAIKNENKQKVRERERLQCEWYRLSSFQHTSIYDKQISKNDGPKNAQKLHT